MANIPDASVLRGFCPASHQAIKVDAGTSVKMHVGGIVSQIARPLHCRVMLLACDRPNPLCHRRKESAADISPVGGEQSVTSPSGRRSLSAANGRKVVPPSLVRDWDG